MEKQDESQKANAMIKLKKGKEGAIEGMDVDYFGRFHLLDNEVEFIDGTYTISKEDAAILYSAFNKGSVAMIKKYPFMGEGETYIYCSKETVGEGITKELMDALAEKEHFKELAEKRIGAINQATWKRDRYKDALDAIPNFIKRLFISKRDLDILNS